MLPDFTCEECIMTKLTNAIPLGLLPGNRITKPFELIYSDLSGKQPIPSYGNSLYYITFIDDYTRMRWIFFLKNKSDATKTVQEFVKYAERQFKSIVLSRITDNGGKYIEVSCKESVISMISYLVISVYFLLFTSFL